MRWEDHSVTGALWKLIIKTQVKETKSCRVEVHAEKPGLLRAHLIGLVIVFSNILETMNTFNLEDD